MRAARSKSANAASTSSSLNKLFASVGELNGVGPALVRTLDKVGIKTILDLLLYIPRRYDDYSNVVSIATAKPGQITVKGRVEKVTSRYIRRGLHITEAVLTDNGKKIKAIWFNQPYRGASLPRDIEVYMSGKLEKVGYSFALSHPSVERVSAFTKNTARIIPIYPETKDLSSSQIRRILPAALDIAKNLDEQLPETLVAKNKLMTIAESFQEIHFPTSIDKSEKARERLEFDELFALILTHQLAKQSLESLSASPIPFNEQLAKDFVAKLPFKLTNAQRLAAWEIFQDLNRIQPTNRLLQGDVGSGKTVIAAMAALMAISHGFQVALMAPTEVLAGQHAKTLHDLLAVFDIEIGLLTGSLKAAARKTLEENISSGKVNLIVGTHALIQKGVDYHNIGLVIVDEQHRFGVEQRKKLVGKGRGVPHLLSMSATPIPRSLALTVYGDLDISVIDEMPPGRKPVATKVVPGKDRDAVYKKVDELIAKGQQAYIICPLVEDSDTLGVKSVTSEYERLQKTVFSHRKIALLHGRLKSTEKEQVLSEFKSGKTDILVSTTVVEVGVDVPNATILIVEGAERFGLAQLHQLRGRVGRGREQSYCYLLTTADFQSRQRLTYLERTNSGFELAEADLQLRGAGEIYGIRQHGELDLRIANLSDSRKIARAKKAVNEFLELDVATKEFPLLDWRVHNFRVQPHLN